MGDVVIGIVHGTANTSTGNQTFTDSNFGGGTPKAAFFIVQAHSGTYGTEQVHARSGYGAAVSTISRWAYTTSAEDDAPTTDNSRGVETDACCLLLEPDGTTYVYEADFVSFGANAVTVNWSTVDGGVNCAVVVVLFGGADLTAELATFNPDADEDASTAISLSFEANVVISCSSGRGAGTGVNSNHAFGLCTNDGVTVSQLGHVYFAPSAQGTSNVRGGWGSGQWVVDGGDSAGYALEYDDFTGSGFNAYTRDDDGDDSDLIGILALDLPADIDAKVIVVTSPTSDGNNDWTGFGFKPQFVMTAMTRFDTDPDWSATGFAGALGTSVVNVNEEFSAMFRDEDEVGTTNTGNILDDKAINLPADTDAGATTIEADFVSFISDGVRLNFTTVPAEARQFGVLAIEEVAAPPAIGQPTHRRWSGVPHMGITGRRSW